MRAVKLYKIGEQLQVEEIPDPVAPPGGAVVRIEAAGVGAPTAYRRIT